jgi:hypothetical protein
MTNKLIKTSNMKLWTIVAKYNIDYFSYAILEVVLSLLASK